MNDASTQVKVCDIVPLHNPLTKVATKSRASIWLVPRYHYTLTSEDVNDEAPKFWSTTEKYPQNSKS